MKKYLFLFTISPVQSFIAQARKTQDLFAGSRLLSDLIKKAILTFGDAAGNVDIRFPSTYENKEAVLPNRFLAELETNENNLVNIGKSVENAVRNEFKSIATNLLEKYVKNEQDDKKKIREQFFWQIENHLNIHWLFELLEGQSYKESFKNIESNLGAIKNIRDFNQLPDWETGRKDSLTGELDALIFNKGGKPDTFTKNAIEITVEQVYLSKGEGLSAVSFVKRFYNLNKNEGFPSTAEIAQFEIKDLIESNSSFNTYKSLFNGNFDYQLLYKDNLNAKYFEKQGLIEFKTNDKTLRNFLSDILKTVKDNGKKQKKYYAVFVFDGDSMGEWLSGKKLGDTQNKDERLIEFHKEFSKLLGEFAANAKKHVDNSNLGKTVYAGGDDFLALLNLDNIFSTVAKLRSMFDEQVNQPLKKHFTEINEDLTFSAGLTIAHYKEPLGEVLNRARAMEHKAKEQTHKNSIAVSVMKHSGEMQESVISWDDVHLFNDIISSLTEEKFSPAFIENLNIEFGTFRKEEIDKGKIDEIINLEIDRLTSRSYTSKRNENESKEDYAKRKKEEIKKMQKDVSDLFIGTQSVNSFLEALNIIDFIYRKA